MLTRMLVVDDEEIIRESLAFVLKKEGYDVDQASNGREALAKHEECPFDIVITDIEMPEMRGVDLLKHVTQRTPETLVIIITAFASVETAVAALRQGASDYVLKPINFDDILHRIRKLVEFRRLALENSHLRQELQRTYDFDAIVGQSPAIKRIFQLIRRVASSEGTVLITGKSGSGKELVAKAIHYNSKRAEKRFVPVNCGAIVDTLFESELFGHKKGSFTGATVDKEGLFKVADGGTLFLDEVSEIPLASQVKLLRALDQKEITPVGTTDFVHVNVRIIAASNKDLRKEVEAGKFREDLFFRLNVIEIDLPPLSDRREDVVLLANHFLDAFKRQMNRNIQGFTNEAMNAILKYTWKGEVRELENVIERAVIFCEENFITLDDLPEYMWPTNSPDAISGIPGNQSLRNATRQFERQYILQVLSQKHGNKDEAAKELGVSLSSLYRKIEDLDTYSHAPAEE